MARQSLNDSLFVIKPSQSTSEAQSVGRSKNIFSFSKKLLFLPFYSIQHEKMHLKEKLNEFFWKKLHSIY